jgi:hypothetical protein
MSMQTKSAVPAGTPATWGSALMPSAPSDLNTALLSYAAQFEIWPRMNVVEAPFNTNVPGEASVLSGVGWSGNGGLAKVVVSGEFTSVTLPA